MRRRLRLFRAWFYCQWFCLWHTFDGWCQFTGSQDDDKVTLLAAVTGSFLQHNMKFRRVFYCEDENGNDRSKEITQEHLSVLDNWSRELW
jgi:hypothetical protein